MATTQNIPAPTTAADVLSWSDWATIIAGGLGALATLIAVCIAAWLAYRYAVRQMRIAHHQSIRQQRQIHNQNLRQEEKTQQLTHQYALEQNKTAHNIAVRSDRLKREISALEAIWGLLIYMSTKKSNKAIIHWESKRGKGGKKEISYFFHYRNLEYFLLHALSDVFYQQHAGLFIPSDIRDQVYGYRASAAIFYFDVQRKKTEIPENSLLPIIQSEQAKQLERIYHELNQRLREELKERYQALEV